MKDIEQIIMIGNFLFAHETPKILDTWPKLEKFLMTSSVYEKQLHIKEFGSIEFNELRLKSLDMHYNEGIEICYINKGKYNWKIEDKTYTLFPGDCVITFPWQEHGSPHGVMDIGQVYWLVIKPKVFEKNGTLRLGYRSCFSAKEQNIIGKKLVNSQKHFFSNKSIKEELDLIAEELLFNDNMQLTLINGLIDRLLVKITRAFVENDHSLTTGHKSKVDILERKLNSNLSHQWTLKEMASVIDIGQTSLNYILKRETGYAPMQYLLNLRVANASEKLQKTTDSITRIAFDSGFCSSQYFSSVFKKQTGYSPRKFRNKGENKD
ncbi:MAG: helix-turn-helix domain-containing protein [Jejuia sp.]